MNKIAENCYYTHTYRAAVPFLLSFSLFNITVLTFSRLLNKLYRRANKIKMTPQLSLK